MTKKKILVILLSWWTEDKRMTVQMRLCWREIKRHTNKKGGLMCPENAWSNDKKQCTLKKKNMEHYSFLSDCETWIQQRVDFLGEASQTAINVNDNSVSVFFTKLRNLRLHKEDDSRRGIYVDLFKYKEWLFPFEKIIGKKIPGRGPEERAEDAQYKAKVIGHGIFRKRVWIPGLENKCLAWSKEYELYAEACDVELQLPTTTILYWFYNGNADTLYHEQEGKAPYKFVCYDEQLNIRLLDSKEQTLYYCDFWKNVNDVRRPTLEMVADEQFTFHLTANTDPPRIRKLNYRS